MTYGGLIVSVLLAWLAHGGLVLVYRKWFASTTTLSFRFAHALEIFLTTGIAMYIYASIVTNQPTVPAAIAVTLGALLVLDGILLAGVKSLRQSFDLWHFASAYFAVATAVMITFSL
jgi:hypothetical protein